MAAERSIRVTHRERDNCRCRAVGRSCDVQKPTALGSSGHDRPDRFDFTDVVGRSSLGTAALS